MRLINTTTFQLDEFFGEDIPKYAILSHTWGRPKDEVTFRDIETGQYEHKSAYQKIRYLCEQATKDELSWAWCDTCCIDKSSSAELSEAINSMFRWYKNAEKCYVLLLDVSIDDSDEPSDVIEAQRKLQLFTARWFTRGWTLQELLAPSSVEFFSANYKRLGDKTSLRQVIHERTGISIQALSGNDLAQFPVNERFTWMAGRKTTREEDEVYSLLGIFDIHMPLLYGEGRENAFKRLYKEIEERNPIDTTRKTTIDPSKLEFARLMWDYLPIAVVPEIDITVYKGELVAILAKDDPLGNPSDWWRCRTRDGRYGYLPSTYLEVVRRGGDKSIR